MTDHVSLRADLAQMSLGFRSLNRNIPGAWLREEFVLRAGIDCHAQPRPKKYRRSTPKQCFANTWRLINRQRFGVLRYCEGFVIHERLPMPIHHAWAIDEQDRVIDVTLEDPASHVYIGVPFTEEELGRRMIEARCHSMLISEFGVVNADMMFARCPELRELLPKAA